MPSLQFVTKSLQVTMVWNLSVSHRQVVVERSVIAVNHNSSLQNYTNLDDHLQSNEKETMLKIFKMYKILKPQKEEFGQTALSTAYILFINQFTCMLPLFYLPYIQLALLLTVCFFLLAV